MKTRFLMTTLLALTVLVSNAGCNENGGDKQPTDMHEVKYQGFTFLCPDILKPAKSFDGEEAPNMFTINGETDLVNVLMCEVSDIDVEFTPKLGKQFAAEMAEREKGAKIETKVLADGLLIKTESQKPDIAPGTIYFGMRLLVHGKKSMTLSFMYSEQNKATLSKYVDAVLNSVKAE